MHWSEFGVNFFQENGMSNPILRLDNISKSFGGVRVLEKVSFDVERGSRHALLLPSDGSVRTYSSWRGVAATEAAKRSWS